MNTHAADFVLASQPILIETDWLAAHYRDPRIRLFDVTSGDTALSETDAKVVPALESFNAGHIPGARYLDLKKDLSDPKAQHAFTMPSPEDFATALRNEGVGNDSFVVLYSTSSYGWATRVWWMLRHVGFKHAAVLNGGRKKWIKEGRELEVGEAFKYPAGDMRFTSAQSLFVGKKEVQRAIASENSCVIDSLSPKQYSGEVEGKNGRRGHIANSINVFNGSLVDSATNTFLRAEKLEQIFREKGVLDKEEVITYCGGGIAATVDAFALTLIGKNNVKVYDASLSEWTADPDLPMAVSEGVSQTV